MKSNILDHDSNLDVTVNLRDSLQACVFLTPGGRPHTVLIIDVHSALQLDWSPFLHRDDPKIEIASSQHRQAGGGIVVQLDHWVVSVSNLLSLSFTQLSSLTAKSNRAIICNGVAVSKKTSWTTSWKYSLDVHLHLINVQRQPNLRRLPQLIDSQHKNTYNAINVKIFCWNLLW